jgi:hypothetical protein
MMKEIVKKLVVNAVAIAVTLVCFAAFMSLLK